MALIEDVIAEILLRLPIKYILRCKSVSKQWLSIITNPIFRRIYSSRSIGYETGLFFMKNNELKSLNQVHEFELLPLIGGPITTRILPSITSSSGGLLLLQSKPKPSGFPDYIVCNPTTNEFKQLPLAPPPITGSPVVLPYLAFDPRKSPHYKILFLCWDKRFEYVIYSSETESFSSPKQLPETSFKYCKDLIYGGYCKDALHWILNESFYYFNINTEIMKHGQLPNAVPRADLYTLHNCKYFGESRGHLFLVVMAVWGMSIYIFRLKSDYSGWSTKFQISIRLLPSQINKFPDGVNMSPRIRTCLFTVLSIIVDREDEENLMLVLKVYGYFMAYNCKREQFVMLGGVLGGGSKMREMRDSGFKYYERFHSWQYIETLACV